MSDTMGDAPLILHLVWDEWNRDHIAKHGVTPSEVEEVVGAVPGKTGFYYPFSARSASRKERRYVLDLGTEP